MEYSSECRETAGDEENSGVLFGEHQRETIPREKVKKSTPRKLIEIWGHERAALNWRN